MTNKDMGRLVFSFPAAFIIFLISGYLFNIIATEIGRNIIADQSVVNYSLLFMLVTSVCFIAGGLLVVPTRLRKRGFWALFLFIILFWYVSLRKDNNWIIMVIATMCGWGGSLIVFCFGRNHLKGERTGVTH